MLKNFKPKAPKDAGQALVEFAIALTIFIPILFVIIDFGWITFQRISFEHGYMHAGWAITASDIGNNDSLDAAPSPNYYSGAPVADPLKTDLVNSSTGIIEGNLIFPKAEAWLRDKDEKYYVPSRNSGVSVEANNRTRYMDLISEIEYTIYPLTPIGGLFLTDNGKITIEKVLTRTKVVASQQRSE